MGIPVDVEFLTLFCTILAGLTAAYFVAHEILVRFRIRALGLTQGVERVVLSDGSACEVRFEPRSRSRAWDLKIQVRSARARSFFLPLPIPKGEAFAQVDPKIIEFARQAHTIGMQWISQRDHLLEIGSHGFRPIKHGHTGFVDRLARGLAQLDSKFANSNWRGTSDEADETSTLPPLGWAILTGLFAFGFLSDTGLSRGALLLDPIPAYVAAAALAGIVFLARWNSLRQQFKKLNRKPNARGQCFWPAVTFGIFALILTLQLNIKLDQSEPRVILTQVVKKWTKQSRSSKAYFAQLKKVDGEETWVVELARDDYRAASVGGTLLGLKFHPGALGMEWREQPRLNEVDRAVASTPDEE